MGQQQLLLVILVTIIVGIATVVAINTFGSAADNATVTGARQDVAQIAASAQSWYMSPAMMGGGGQSFQGLTFEDIAFGADSLATGDPLTAYSAYATYTFPAPGAGSEDFIITATINDSDDSELQARVCVDTIIMADIDGGAPGACP